MTVRERLDALTAKLWTSIDAALDESTPPDANSIAASQTAIDTAVTELAAITGATTTADLNAQITAITAIAAGQRTQAQKDMLVLLRIVKAQDAAIVAPCTGRRSTTGGGSRRCSGCSPSLPGSPCSSTVARPGCGPATWTAKSDDLVAGRAQGGSVTGYCTLSPGTTLTLAAGQQGQVGVGTGTPAPGGWSPTAHPAGWKKVT